MIIGRELSQLCQETISVLNYLYDKGLIEHEELKRHLDIKLKFIEFIKEDTNINSEN